MSGEEQEAQTVRATGYAATSKAMAKPTNVRRKAPPFTKRRMGFYGVTIPRHLEADPSLRFGMTMRSYQ